MRRATVLLAFLLAATASAQDDDVARARAEFDDIVRVVSFLRFDRDPDGDSLTRRIQKLLGHGPGVVREVEAAAWKQSKTAPYWKGVNAPPTEQLIRFLHALPIRRGEFGLGGGGFDLVAGAVVFPPDSGLHMLPDYSVEPLDVPFDDLVGRTPVRSLTEPAAAALLAGFDANGLKDRSRSEMVDFGMALGEACTSDESSGELRRRFESRPDDIALLVALGWTKRADAVRLLTDRIDVLATRRNIEGPWRMVPIKAATCALRHASMDAYDKLLLDLPVEKADRVVATLGPVALVKRRLGAVERAADRQAWRSAMLRLCDFTWTDCEVPEGGDALRLFRALLAGVDSGDAEVRTASLRTVDTFLYGGYHTRGGGSHSWSGPDSSSSDDDLFQRGSYCGSETLVRMLVDDLTRGRVRFVDGRSELPYERTPPVMRPAEAARSDHPDFGAQGKVPAHLSARWVDGGLRLSIRNVDEHPFAIDVVGLRYGGLETTTQEIRFPDGRRVTRKPISLRLGWLQHAVVPDTELRVVSPGDVYECVLPVSEEFRGTKDIDVAIADDVCVEGTSTVPVLLFSDTMVR